MRPSDAQQLLTQIDALLQVGVDLLSADPETTRKNIRLLAAAASFLNIWLLERYGGHPGEDRGADLLEQIVAAPFQTFGGEEAHPDPFEKAAMLWRGIIQGHPFGDGNKRAGFALAAYYLHLIGLDPPIDAWDEEEVYDVNMRISSGDLRNIETLVGQLWDWWGVAEDESE